MEIIGTKHGLDGQGSSILKRARTIADLVGEEQTHQSYLTEAIQYRGQDRKLG